MGQTILRQLVVGDEQTQNIQVVGALEHKNSTSLGKDAGHVAGMEAMDIPISAKISEVDFDVMVDFSSPGAVAEHIALCKSHDAAIVIGTTGLNDAQNQTVGEGAKVIPVLFAANTSVGVNLCASLVEMATKVLGEVTDIEIIEAHHRQKVDAPSGTALLLGEAVANAMGTDISACGVFTREGNTGPRESGTIGFSTIRGGDIAGEHTVMFIGDSERIEITHRATDRKIFAQGAIRAVQWVANKEKGLFNMQDVLDLR